MNDDTPESQPLTPEQMADVLAFEGLRWRYAGAKEAAIRTRFGWRATRYYQVLNSIVDQPEALEVDAPLVHRLRRLREARLAARSARRAGWAS